MALSDRIYYRDPAGQGSFRPAGLSITTWLIIINSALFVITAMTARGDLSKSPFWVYGSFNTTDGFQRLEVWRLLTFQFLHAGPIHLLFNMLGLHFFGRAVEDHVGGKRYLAFYLCCGIFGGLCYLLLNLIGNIVINAGGPPIPGLLFNKPTTPLVGASAGVFGVIMACAYIQPNAVVQLLIPPVPLKMRTFAYVFLGLAALNLFIGGANAGGDAAHIGGALAGYFFIRNIHLLRDFFDVFNDSRKPGPKSDRPKRSGFFRSGSNAPRSAQRLGPAPSQRRPDPVEPEIDRILAKVSQSGLHSLTDAEKAALRAASERRRAAD